MDDRSPLSCPRLFSHLLRSRCGRFKRLAQRVARSGGLHAPVCSFFHRRLPKAEKTIVLTEPSKRQTIRRDA